MNTAGHFVSATCRSRFEYGERTESFVKVDGGQQIIAGYDIDAPALVIG